MFLFFRGYTLLLKDYAKIVKRGLRAATGRFRREHERRRFGGSAAIRKWRGNGVRLASPEPAPRRKIAELAILAGEKFKNMEGIA